MKPSGRENTNPNHRERRAKDPGREERSRKHHDHSKAKPTVRQFKCNVCYKHTGYFMADCGCFFCKECFQDANSSADPDSTCIICNKPKTRSFDLRDKRQLS